MAQDGQDDLEARRKQLESELGALKRKKGTGDRETPKTTDSDRREMSKALKLSSEFISAIFVGFILGYLLDRFVGTSPWGMIGFLLLGFGAGILNVLRSVGRVAEPEDRIKRDEN
ncbi:AtpZ/AtpI family protein [Martelella endophytica]|uniref:ATP synthase protein I n=1 Tax=Martelella endophytica TaxID=1486262 RepID=A0A0D5LPD0_MAREN|nr:AtpZ/AtpI family protein [Martelella endophytica]AJY45622.1 ATP synthase [Martelella endophytica]